MNVPHFGKYEVVSDLGRGGSGNLYRAYDPAVGRHVAVKVLSGPVDERRLDRFRREAAAAGKLQHRNIVSVFDFGVEDGQTYLVIELLEGQDLARRIETGPALSALEAAEIMQQVADGLEHAHKNGVVHRDVTPRNIWLQPDRTVKIIDFGIATQGNELPHTLGREDRAGTLLYLSPEHVSESGEEPDARSDIFSFGTVFYELIAGRNPFDGPDEAAIVCNILVHAPEPIRTLAPHCPESLAAIIHRALAREPDLRYQNLRQLQIDLGVPLSELKREAADALLEDARQLESAGQWEAAQAALHDALHLTPEHPAARELLSRVNDRIHRAELDAKVGILLQAAAERAAGRQFREAVKLLKRAQQLDPGNAAVERQLQDAGLADRRSQQSLALVRESEQALRSDPAAALAKLQEALGIDSECAEAAALLPAAREAVEQFRRARLARGLADARQLLASEQFVAAIVLLESLGAEFPESGEVPALIAYARSEVQSRRRARVVAAATEEARVFAAFGQFELAFGVIRQALLQYPGDEVLLRLEKAALDGRQARESYSRDSSTTTGGSSSGRCTCGNAVDMAMKFCDRCGQRLVVRE